MSAYDKYHELVKKALIKDGWTITHDPYKIGVDGRVIKIDLAAEKLISAEKGEEKIAVEVKSFLEKSQITAFYSALGKSAYYKKVIKDSDPDRTLYLAVPNRAYRNVFSEMYTKATIEEVGISMLVYDIKKEIIVLWKK